MESSPNTKMVDCRLQFSILRASRKPVSGYQRSGLALERTFDRIFSKLWGADPPRRTRFDWNTVVSVHSQTLPPMSKAPDGLLALG